TAAIAARAAEEEGMDFLLAARWIAREAQPSLAQRPADLGQDLSRVGRPPVGGDPDARIPRIAGVEVHLAGVDDEGLARYLDAATRRELEIAAHLRLLTEGDLCRARERDVEIGAGELHVSTEAEAEQPRQGPAPSLLRLSERLDHLDGF